MLVLKKLNEAKVDSKTSQLQTNDDNFEVLPAGNIPATLGNLERFNQFLKVQLANPKAANLSIRVMIDERYGEEQDPQIIDYQFFRRETTLLENKKYQEFIGAQKK